MLQSLRIYALALAATSVAFLTYWLTLGFLLQPNVAPKIASRPVSSSRSERRHPIDHLFEVGSWELDNPRIAETPQGSLLFRDWKALGPKKVEIVPCTLVLLVEEKREADFVRSGRPVVIQSERAELDFVDDANLTLGKFGGIKGGVLAGKIRVFAPETTPGLGDDFELNTTDLQIEPTKAWTPHDIDFRYGPHRGSGSDLAVEFLPAARPVGKKAPGLAVGGISVIRLEHVDKFEFQLAKNLFAKDAASGRTKENAEQPKDATPAPAIAKCSGPFEYRLLENEATFRDRVVITQPSDFGANNELRADRVELKWKSESSVTTTEAAPSVPRKEDDGLSRIEKFVAIGRPATIDAPSFDLGLRADRIDFDRSTDRLKLVGNRPDRPIWVKRDRYELEAPELLYEAEDFTRLGVMFVPGPGLLAITTESHESTVRSEIRWGRELRLKKPRGRHVASLRGGVSVHSPTIADYRSDELHVWLLELFADVREPLANGEEAYRVVIDRLKGVGAVHADSPSAVVDANEIQAWFANAPLEIGNGPKKQSIPSDDLVLLDPSAERQRQPMRIREPGRQSSTDAPPQRFHLKGALVQMQLISTEKAYDLDEVTVTGSKVSISELDVPPETGFQLSGTQVIGEGLAGEGAQIFRILGAPAKVKSQGTDLRSDQIEVRGRDNRVVIDRPGKMLIPMKQDLNGQPIQEAIPVELTWDEGLEFDGLVAKFHGNVEMKGPTQTGVAERLEATFTNRVGFGGQRTAMDKVDVRKLSMIGSVELESEVFSEVGPLSSLERMECEQLSFDRPSGKIFAQGPGRIRSTRVGKAMDLRGRTSFASAGNGPRDSEQNDKLSYLVVHFEDRMEGSTNEKEVTLFGQVDAVYGEVLGWNESIQVDMKATPPEGVFTLASDQLTVREAIKPSNAKSNRDFELETKGSTLVQSDQFTGWAHRLSFDSTKDQLIFEGDGRNDAEIRRRAGGSTTARRILLNRTNNTLQVDDARVLDSGQLIAPKSPSGATAKPPPSPRDYLQRKRGK